MELIGPYNTIFKFTLS